MAQGEQADFDRAQAALEAGQPAEAATLFAAFAETYPAGPLTAPAHLGRGEALSASDDPKAAARAYLDAFSFDPEGAQAPRALLRLGESLGALGQTDEACVTFGEVQIRWPDTPIVAEAEAARATFACP
jgi:tol-pal system protein YbgF